MKTFPKSTEQIQDIVAALLVEGTGVTLAYNDGAGTLTISSSVDLTGYATTAYVDDEVSANGVSLQAFASNASNLSSGTVPIERLPNLSEVIDDEVATLLQAGTNITLSYNDAANTLTINASGGGGGTPGGSTGQVQFNDSGAFGGFGSWNGTQLAVAGTVNATKTGAGSAVRNAFSTFPTGATRNDANFTIGYTFVPADFITISELGRLYVAGNTQDHQIGIWDKVAGTLVASGTVLAASSSDANGFKYVSISPVTLDPAKEYVIGAKENAGGDTWKDGWTSTGYYDPFVKRTGSAFLSSATFGIPTSFSSGTTSYNTVTFKFTTQSTPQVEASYDASNSLLLLSRSDGTATITTKNNDKVLALMNPLGIGTGSIPAGYQLAVIGNSIFTGGYPLQVVNASGVTGHFGANNGAGLNGIFLRGGYTLVEGGSSGVLINYDNPTKDVTVGGTIIASTKFSIANDSATKAVLRLRAAASQSAALLDAQNSAGTSLFTVDASGSVLTASNFTLGNATGGIVQTFINNNSNIAVMAASAIRTRMNIYSFEAIRTASANTGLIFYTSVANASGGTVLRSPDTTKFRINDLSDNPLDFECKNISATGWFDAKHRPYTFAGLPLASAAQDKTFVCTDSTLGMTGTNYGNTPAGGGANRVKLFSNGTSWILG